MRQKLVYMFVGIVLVAGLIILPQAPNAEAGSNGQQLSFVRASESRSVGINWIRVNGTYYTGSNITWYKQFSPPFTGEYFLSNYWWKNNAFIEFSVRNSNGSNFYNNCWVTIPTVMSGNWVRVYLDRGTSRTCGK